MEQEERLQALDLNRQGQALMRSGSLKEAKEWFGRAIQADPMTAESYRNLGELALRQGDYAEAKNQYAKSLLIEKSGEAYFQYGNACFLRDEPHEGLKYYNLALSSGFDNDEMLFFMGLAYEHMNDDRMALRYIQKAMRRNPSRPDYKVKKVSVLMRLHMNEEAEVCVDEILKDDPELFDGYHMKTILLMNEGKQEEAVAFAQNASERFPKDAELLFDYANACAMAGDPDAALRSLDTAKRMSWHEQNGERFALLEAQVLMQKDDVEGAVSKCREAISFETEEIFRTDAHFLLINLYILKEDFKDALEESDLLIRKDIRDPYYYAAWYYRPFCMKKLGREEATKFYREAISMYRMATLKNPSEYEAYLYRAMCLKDLGEYDEALKMLDFMEKLNDQIAETYSIRAEIYSLTGRKSEASGQIERAVSIKPELKDVLKGKMASA